MRTQVPDYKTKPKAQTGGNAMHLAGKMTLERFLKKHKDGFVVPDYHGRFHWHVFNVRGLFSPVANKGITNMFSVEEHWHINLCE